ncbi:MAG: N-acetylneuraminate synthase family protein [Asticcacaulis sp.]
MNIKAAGREIGEGQPCFIIAEIGANHDGDLSRARDMIAQAAEYGVDAVKLQLYTAGELLADPERVILHGEPGEEVSEPIGALFDRLVVPREACEDLFDYARSLGLIPFATPFSPEGAAHLGGIGMPLFKVAASDLCYFDMIDEIARWGKPTILSAGKCTLAEIDLSVSHARKAGIEGLGLLHCVAQYPAPHAEMKLSTIPVLKALYPDCVVGLSDHSIGIASALGAVALGAKIIEKHVTYDKNAPGPDHWFSADPAEMALLVREVRALEAALPGVRQGVLDCERHERETSVRSLVTARAVKAGDVLRKADLKAVRPGTGIHPADQEKIIGLRVPRDLAANHVLSWTDFK